MNTRIAATAAAIALLPCAALGQSVQSRTVALSGQPAPGMPGVTFDTIGEPRITRGGVVAFWATLAGTGITTDNDGSVWVDRGSGPVLTYQDNMPALGTTGVIGGMAGLDLSEDGLVGFAASIFEAATPNAPTNIAYYAETAPANMSLLIREPANTQVLSTLLPLNASGHAAWTTGTTIVVSGGQTITTSTPVPGQPPNVTFRRFSEPLLTNAGAIIFNASFGADATTNNWSYGLFTTRTGPLTLLARTATQVPGMPTGVIFAELATAPIASPGGAAYAWARFKGGPTQSGLDTGIFSEQNGEMRALVKAGDPAADIPGAAFTRFAKRFAVTDDGSVVFQAFISGTPSNSGVFIAQPGQGVRLLARRNDWLMGMPQGAFLNVLGEPRVGGASKVAFTAQLYGPGATADGRHALFAGDTRLRPSMLLRVGDPFDVAGIGTKTIRSISFDTESADTGRSQMSGRTLLVTLTFTDRTQGVFALTLPCTADFNGDGDVGTDADIEAFFACLAGNCCDACGSADFDTDGDTGTDADIEAFFRVLAGGAC